MSPDMHPGPTGSHHLHDSQNRAVNSRTTAPVIERPLVGPRVPRETGMSRRLQGWYGTWWMGDARDRLHLRLRIIDDRRKPSRCQAMLVIMHRLHRLHAVSHLRRRLRPHLPNTIVCHRRQPHAIGHRRKRHSGMKVVAHHLRLRSNVSLAKPSQEPSQQPTLSVRQHHPRLLCNNSSWKPSQQPTLSVRQHHLRLRSNTSLAKPSQEPSQRPTLSAHQHHLRLPCNNSSWRPSQLPMPCVNRPLHRPHYANSSLKPLRTLTLLANQHHHHHRLTYSI